MTATAITATGASTHRAAVVAAGEAAGDEADTGRNRAATGVARRGALPKTAHVEHKATAAVVACPCLWPRGHLPI